MFSVRKTMSGVLLILGISLVCWAIYCVAKIKFGQVLLNIEAVRFEEENTFSFQGLTFDYSEELGLSSRFNKMIEIERDPFKREWYENGMMIINIPKIKMEAPVVKATTEDYLKLGPGLYEKSVLPDKDGGNVCIAAHRTTYGAWFRKVDSLAENDDIFLEFNGRKYNYKVEKVFVVEKNDWSVINETGYSSITLTACHPPGSDRQRIVVRGRLVG